MFDFERDIYKNMIFRVELMKVLNDDGDKLQQIRASGYKGEELETMRAQQHGLTSNPPEGSLGYGLNINGRRENAFLIGCEHPDHRPTGFKSGETALYDSTGQKIHHQQNGTRHTVTSHSVHISDGNAVHRVQPNGYHIVETDNIAKIRFKIGSNWFALSPTALVSSTKPPDDPTRA